MRRLDRYIIRELIVPFSIGTLSVLLMFQANQLIYWFKSSNLTAVPVTAIAQAILYMSPKWLVMTLPVGVALASSLAVSRLTRECEITAMRSAGASLIRIVWPIMVFGAFVGIGNYYVAEHVTPAAEKASRNVQSKFSLLSMVPDFVSNVVLKLPRFTVCLGTVQKQPQDRVLLTDILVVERPLPGEVRFTRAETGEYKDGVWRLRDTRMWWFKSETLWDFKFDKSKDSVFNEKITITDMFMPPVPDELSIPDLSKAIRDGKRQGRDMTATEITFHTRYSVPAACVIFGLVGPVLSFWLSKGGGFVGVLLSIFMVFLYYNAYVITTQILGPNHLLSPWLSAWLPDILFIALGLFALRRLE